jgi:dCMP deaminase
MTRPDWDTYFLNIAEAVATRADCRRAQHGAVIVKNNRIISTGYNGSPPGGKSCLAGECPRGLLSQEQLAHLSADYTNCIALHAETNAVAFASGADTAGATIYIAGGHAPCDMCSKLLSAAGITRVVYA